MFKIVKICALISRIVWRVFLSQYLESVNFGTQNLRKKFRLNFWIAFKKCLLAYFTVFDVLLGLKFIFEFSKSQKWRVKYAFWLHQADMKSCKKSYLLPPGGYRELPPGLIGDVDIESTALHSSKKFFVSDVQ